jgi:GWxTD domain-containing protein
LACSGNRNIGSENLSSVYKHAEKYYHPEFNIHFENDTVALVAFKLNVNELLKVKQPDGNYACFLKIEYRLIDSYDDAAVNDTGKYFFKIIPDNKLSEFKMFTFPVMVRNKHAQLLDLVLTDQNRKVSEAFFVGVDNVSNQGRHHFSVKYAVDSMPLFRKYLLDTDTFFITHHIVTANRARVDFYRRSFPLAPPPFAFEERSAFDYLPDSIFYIGINDGTVFTFQEEGFYHVRLDSTVKEGLTLFRFSKGFPSVKTAAAMLEPARYLISRKEYDEMKADTNSKAAIERFWLEKGSNSERARSLIKTFYNRVAEANKFFTSFTEGWRTDRGMLYLVFGQPNVVYKSADSETWVYGQTNNPLSLNFFFTKVKNPFSDNDYLLNRSPIYEASWYRAVDTWRQGRAYNMNPY